MDCPCTWIARCATGPGTLGWGLPKHVSRGCWGICSSDTSLGAMTETNPFSKKKGEERAIGSPSSWEWMCPDASGRLCVSCHWTANRKGEQLPLDILHGSHLWYVPSLRQHKIAAGMDGWAPQMGILAGRVWWSDGVLSVWQNMDHCKGVRLPWHKAASQVEHLRDGSNWGAGLSGCHLRYRW